MGSKEPNDTITLSTNLGLISGEIVKVGDDCKVAKFLGIPYAQQPIGDLRFEPLQPIEGKLDSNEGPFVANKHGNSAYQTKESFFATHNQMSEDCIYLDIFVSLSDEVLKDPALIVAENLPVLFHIHGGGFHMGSGGEPYYDMCNFAATHRAVGVSINYRLNYLGFISLEGGEIEENLGLKDQQFALKWTHDNIGSFGGDPDNVTLFGCSAGGASGHYHMLSEESSKYFKRVLALSGVMTKAWSMCSRKTQKERVNKLLAKLKCPKDATPAEVKKFLKSLSMEELFKFYPEGMAVDGSQFGPVDVFERDVLSSSGFIANKPIILGCCSEEGNMFPDIVFPRKDTSTKTRARRVLAKAGGEALFYGPLRKTLSELLEIPEIPTYVYMFDYACPARSDEYPETQLRLHYGCYHSLDNAFVMGMMKKDASVLKINETDVNVQDTIDEIVGAFIRSSDDPGEKFPLRRFEKGSEIVNKITENGIGVEQKDCLERYKKVPMAKTIASAILVKTFPDHF